MLTTLTGEKLGPSVEAWKKWWDDHRGALVAQGVRAPTVKMLNKVDLGAALDYYGLQLKSRKLLFLLDISGSMNETIGEPGVTTGQHFTGKKIDIAVKVLKKAVMELQAGTWFNIILFSTDARYMHENLLVEATRENKALTCMQLDDVIAKGSTWTHGALRLAFGLLDPGVTPSKIPVDTIVLLSDGAPTEPGWDFDGEAKAMDPQVILDFVKKANSFNGVTIHTIAIDTRIEKTGKVFVRFMKDLAAQNNGKYTAIGDDK